MMYNLCESWMYCIISYVIFVAFHCLKLNWPKCHVELSNVAVWHWNDWCCYCWLVRRRCARHDLVLEVWSCRLTRQLLLLTKNDLVRPSIPKSCRRQSAKQLPWSLRVGAVCVGVCIVTRAFRFKTKYSDSIRFSETNRFFRFDSIQHITAI